MSDSLIKSTSIMFTDVVGYSRMIGRDEKNALKLLDEHNSIIQKSIDKYNGRIIKLIGDSVFAEFDSSINCVQSAIDIQISLRKRNQLCRKKDSIQIRVGLHYGQVVVKDVILPKEFNLERAYPNPFNPITTLQYSLSKDSRVSLIIYDLQGKIVDELVNDIKMAGYYSLTWNASIHASGIYFVKMQAYDPFEDSGNSYVHTQKIVLIK